MSTRHQVVTTGGPRYDCFLVKQVEHGVLVYGNLGVSHFPLVAKLVRAMDKTCTHMLFMSGLDDPDFGPPTLIFGSPKKHDAWRALIWAQAEEMYGKRMPRAWWYGPDRGLSSGYLVSTWARGKGIMLPLVDMALPHDASDWKRCADAMTYLGFTLSGVSFPESSPWVLLQAREQELRAAGADAVAVEAILNRS